MKKISVTIKLCQYDDLKKKSKEKAYDDHFEMLHENGDIMDMGTPDTQEIVEDSLRINEYWFFSDGQMADTVIYTGDHPKSGISELRFKGETYIF